MSEWADLLRWLHVIGATVLLGTGAGIAFFMLMAQRTGRADLVAHVAGPTEDGWRIINIWQDEAAFRRFQSERLVRAAGLAAQEDGFDPTKAANFRSLSVDGAEMPF